MKQKFDAIISSIAPLLPTLEVQRSLSAVGKVLLPMRSESLMRGLTFSQEPIDCLLFAIDHLKNGEDDLTEALSWMNAVHDAYKSKQPPTFWHDLAEAIRLDIMTQLNGLRLVHVLKSERETSSQLSQSQFDHSTQEKLVKTKELLIGLMGYHLGRGIEIGQEAYNGYTQLVAKTIDERLILLLNQRATALDQHSYLNPADFNMTNQEFHVFRGDKSRLQGFVNKCCLEGAVPTRPHFEEKITKDVFMLAGLSVFAGPLALIIIPTALATIPIFKIVDRVNYAKDQQKNSGYYAVLDEAHSWIKVNIQKEAEKLCPNHQALSKEVQEIAQNYAALAKTIHDRNLSQALKATLDHLSFKRDNLGDKRVKNFREQLDSTVDRSIKIFDTLMEKIKEGVTVANEIANYMHSYSKQLTANDGLYHPGQYDKQDLDSVALDKMPLAELPVLLKSYETAMTETVREAGILSRDITIHLNSVKTEIEQIVTANKERAKNKVDSINQLEDSIRSGIR